MPEYPCVEVEHIGWRTWRWMIVNRRGTTIAFGAERSRQEAWDSMGQWYARHRVDVDA